MRRRACRSVWSVGAAFVVCACAHGESFTGHVYDAATGAPLEGVIIVAGTYDGASDARYGGVTDSAGWYEIAGLSPAGDQYYTVIASLPGYASGYETCCIPPEDIDFELERAGTGFLVSTVNQGVVEYELNGSFWCRTDGVVWAPGELIFPDLHARGASITRLLDDIGAGTDLVSDPRTIWERCGVVWDWLGENTWYAPWDAEYSSALDFLGENDNWPSVGRIAETWERYGSIPWAACFSRAQILTTLLYRCGLPPECLAIATTRLRISDSEHSYTAVRVGPRWMYLDPAAVGQPFPDYEHRHSIPLRPEGTEDRDHPYRMTVLPRSRIPVAGPRLTAVPELSRRGTVSDRIGILSPPNGAVTTAKEVRVAGFAGKGIGAVLAGRRRIAVNGGRFEFLHAPPAGESTLTVMAEDRSCEDSITLRRYRAGTGAVPWWP